ncbi:hypothetical protein LINGRAHAP2_LOCUS27819 [Linum grandiflorum]
MAQFTTQGRLKFLFNSGGAHYKHLGSDSLDGSKSFQLHKARLRLHAKPGKFYAQARRGDGRNRDSETDGTLGLNHDEDEEDYQVEFQTDELACFRGLVLDIAYRPVNVVCWKRAICLEFMEKADVLEYYDQTVNSPSGSYYIPAVLRVRQLLQVVKTRRIKNSLSRKNILHRDSYICQYCYSSENLTIDHVFPASRGGEWKWENLVAACSKCNSKKGQKTLEEVNMKLIKMPKAPKEYEILAIPLTSAALMMLTSKKGTPQEWRQYLPPQP